MAACAGARVSGPGGSPASWVTMWFPKSPHLPGRMPVLLWPAAQPRWSCHLITSPQGP